MPCYPGTGDRALDTRVVQASLSHTADTGTLRDLEERLAAATEKIRELMAGRERRTGELLGTVPHECSEFEVQRGQFKTLT